MCIRTRGLVNSGNLCFANAVLQVLVSCPPFWRFFTDFGRFLEPTEDSKTPLVDATIRNLHQKRGRLLKARERG
ncbi:hypothetical protein BDR07DRAFT_1433338 [Suillus spraguei]|nr:hypothetical protein BDR07DRAFT_1433338 [Suillus spraguei]